MIAVLDVLSFLVIALTAGYLLKVTLSDMLPFVWCAIVLVLYVLAFGRGLNLIDILLPACAVGLLAYVFLRFKKKEGISGADASSYGPLIGDIRSYLTENVTSAGVITYLILCIVIPLAQHTRIVTWWDDINYWASDLKSLYFFNGFAAKYANVSPHFGDYPPGVQLAKWFTVHMNKSGFDEGLAFTGYYLFNLSFIMPLFKNIRGRAAVVSPLLALASWGFAGIGDVFGYGGFCADLSMAFLFGSILISVVDATAPGMIRSSLYMAVLVISKSTGAFWVAFALIVLIVYRLLEHKSSSKKEVLRIFSVAILPVITGASWMVFCLINRRVTQTTSTAVAYLTTDKYGLSPYKNEFAAAFIKAFFTQPVHMDRTWIDLPPAAVFVLITVLLILLRKFGYLSGREGTFVFIALPVMGILYYAVIFVAHLTIFATETQYLEPEGMIASIERYGAPFVIGCFLFMAYLWLMKGPASLRVKVFLLAVLMLTNIPAAYNGLLGYRTDVKQEKALRANYIDPDSDSFLKTVAETFGLRRSDNYAGTIVSEFEYEKETETAPTALIELKNGTRVCRVRDGAFYWVSDAYTAYEASPVSVISLSFDLKDANTEFFANAVSSTHASYVYVDRQPYDDIFLDTMTDGGKFSYGELYRISYENGQMILYGID
ncbi:MAG: hypothetical protein K6G12_08320 [Lachnospiraceae bacterium]|nr:hypothetical protein [Lachnospiraceae bacterium]